MKYKPFLIILFLFVCFSCKVSSDDDDSLTIHDGNEQDDDDNNDNNDVDDDDNDDNNDEKESCSPERLANPDFSQVIILS